MSRASDSVLVTEVHKNFRIAVYTGAYKFAYYIIIMPKSYEKIELMVMKIVKSHLYKKDLWMH